MTKKKTDQKPKQKPAEESIEKDEHADDTEMYLEISGKIYKTLMTGAVPPLTLEKVQMAEAVALLRKADFNRDNPERAAFADSLAASREPIIRTLLASVRARNLHMVDAYLLAEMIAKEMLVLPLWEYENIDASDVIMEYSEQIPSDGFTKKLLDALKKGQPPGQEQETDAEAEDSIEG